jgi:hypothetical protein
MKTRFGHFVRDAELSIDRCNRSLEILKTDPVAGIDSGLGDYWRIQLEYANIREAQRLERLKDLCSYQIKWQLGIYK